MTQLRRPQLDYSNSSQSENQINSSYSQSEPESSESIDQTDRVRSIKINQQKNVIHTFERYENIQEESNEGSQVYSSENQEKSDLEISQSLDGSEDDVDQLERRIRKLQGSLEKNLKQLPRQTIKKPMRTIEGEQNSNIINLTQKSVQKKRQKTQNPIKSQNLITLKQQSKKIKKNIKQKCKKALLFRKQRQQLANLRVQISKKELKPLSTKSSKQPIKKIPKPTKQSKQKLSQKQGKLQQIQKQLELLKTLDSLQLKLKTSINKKVAKMYEEIQGASSRVPRQKSKQLKRIK